MKPKMKLYFALGCYPYVCEHVCIMDVVFSIYLTQNHEAVIMPHSICLYQHPRL